ncbi:MAG: glycosyltransferase family 39 protein [Armatimonadetes bacterium]|nr:glycosyltransferase family 39 protein [Armatimonadota bacterium]
MFASTFGITYDEPVYAAVGVRHTTWLGRVLRFDTGAWRREALEAGWGNSGPTPSEADWHPPVGKVWLDLCRRLPSPFGPYAQFRLGSTLLWAGTAVVLLLWLGEMSGLLAGLGAALAWLTLPSAVLHGNLAALDNPAAFLATLATYLAWRHMAQPSRARAVSYGVVLGLGMATKFNVVLLTPAVLLAAALWARPALRGLWPATCLLAPMVFVLCWPWLWYDGPAHLAAVIRFHGRHALIDTEYFGRISGQLPWHYPFVMLAVTTPLATLAAAALGLRGLRGDVSRRLIALALLLHMLPFASPSAAKYNGVRLFLPALPLLSALAGLGLATLAAGLRGRLPSNQRRLVAPLLLVGLVLPAAVDVLSVHPYPTAFYNRLVGGSGGAARRGLEVSYWGEPFRELLAVLSREAPDGATIYLHPPGAIAGLSSYRAVGIQRRDLRLTHGEEAARTADYFVYQNRPSEWDDLGRELRRERRPIYTAMGGDAPVGFIWARKETGKP